MFPALSMTKTDQWFVVAFENVNEDCGWFVILCDSYPFPRSLSVSSNNLNSFTPLPVSVTDHWNSTVSFVTIVLSAGKGDETTGTTVSIWKDLVIEVVLFPALSKEVTRQYQIPSDRGSPRCMFVRIILDVVLIGLKAALLETSIL